jgi:prevent-host-death family protein
MKVFNIHDAKTSFSRLVDDAIQGTEVVIAKSGKPVAKLVPFEPPAKKRKLGILAGVVRIPDAFYDPLLEDVLDRFEEP